MKKLVQAALAAALAVGMTAVAVDFASAADAGRGGGFRDGLGTTRTGHDHQQPPGQRNLPGCTQPCEPAPSHQDSERHRFTPLTPSRPPVKGGILGGMPQTRRSRKDQDPAKRPCECMPLLAMSPYWRLVIPKLPVAPIRDLPTSSTVPHLPAIRYPISQRPGDEEIRDPGP